MDRQLWICILAIAAILTGVLFYSWTESAPQTVEVHRETDRVVDHTKEEQERMAVELAEARKEADGNVVRVREAARADVCALSPDAVAVRLRELLRASRREFAGD